MRFSDIPSEEWDYIHKGAELFRYVMKVVKMDLTDEEERGLGEIKKREGFEAFKRAVDLLEARPRGASPEEYAEHHGRKEGDMR